MDHRPIGVFDSGMGGLTAMRQLLRVLPNEDLCYFGDTGRVPYGNRSRDTLIKYARQDVAFLRQFNPKAIVVACGTVSTTALSILQAENDIPILGVVEPAAEMAVRMSKSGRIGIIGTSASIKSGAYGAAILKRNPEAVLISRACPLLVPLVEEGRVHLSDTVTVELVREYLAPMKEAHIDTLVLGCTHFPLLSEIIAAEMGEDVVLVDTGRQCAEAIAELLRKNDALTDRKTEGTRRYFASDSPTDFVQQAESFLGSPIEGGAEYVEIERY